MLKYCDIKMCLYGRLIHSFLMIDDKEPFETMLNVIFYHQLFCHATKSPNKLLFRLQLFPSETRTTTTVSFVLQSDFRFNSGKEFVPLGR